MDDDDMPKNPFGEVILGEDLARLSIDELNHRLTLLDQEIARVRTEIATRQSHISAAEQAFKK